MKAYATRVATVCARLNEHRARYVVVGATAMQLWGTTRATRDIDVLIEATVPNARRVLAALGAWCALRGRTLGPSPGVEDVLPEFACPLATIL